ncbi:MAG: hypothetical protein WAU41_03845 [Gaiellaceae bacterium]
MSSSNGAARAAGFFGALAVLANPAGVAAAQVLKGVALIRALYVSVPVAVLLALIAVVAARRARFARARSVFAEAQGRGRPSRFLAWAGLYAAVTGALALGIYGALRWAGS